MDAAENYYGEYFSPRYPTAFAESIFLFYCCSGNRRRVKAHTASRQIYWAGEWKRERAIKAQLHEFRCVFCNEFIFPRWVHVRTPLCTGAHEWPVPMSDRARLSFINRNKNISNIRLSHLCFNVHEMRKIMSGSDGEHDTRHESQIYQSLSDRSINQYSDNGLRCTILLAEGYSPCLHVRNFKNKKKMCVNNPASDWILFHSSGQTQTALVGVSDCNHNMESSVCVYTFASLYVCKCVCVCYVLSLNFCFISSLFGFIFYKCHVWARYQYNIHGMFVSFKGLSDHSTI